MLFASESSQEIGNLQSFVAEDDSGSFCILPNHDYFMTMLSFGMATLRDTQGHTSYLALPGGFLHFRHNQMVIHTRRYWIDDDYAVMADTLRTHTNNARETLHKNKSNLSRIEESMMRRMLDMEARS
jgi:alternate F1F0 ATPase F1 subunit epsilon